MMLERSHEHRVTLGCRQGDPLAEGRFDMAQIGSPAPRGWGRRLHNMTGMGPEIDRKIT